MKAAEADAEVSSQLNTSRHPASPGLGHILSPFLITYMQKPLTYQTGVVPVN